MGQTTFDISDMTRLRFSYRGENYPVPLFRHNIKGRPMFPKNTRGALYYHTDPAVPPIAGEVRFRLCDTVEDFERGSDLHIHGTRWSLPLTRIAYNSSLIGLRKLLVKEGLVDSQLMTDVSKLANLDKLDDRLTLFHLSHPFLVDFTVSELNLTLVTRNALHRVRFQNLFTDRRSGHPLPLYSGKRHEFNVKHMADLQIGIMRARFEVSNLPVHRTSGPVLVMRFLESVTKIEDISPGSQGGLLLCPKPDDLLHRRPRLHSQPKLWTYPLNGRRHAAVLKDFIAATNQGF